MTFYGQLDEQLDHELHASRLWWAYLAVRVLGIQGLTLDIDFVDVWHRPHRDNLISTWYHSHAARLISSVREEHYRHHRSASMSNRKKRDTSIKASWRSSSPLLIWRLRILIFPKNIANCVLPGIIAPALRNYFSNYSTRIIHRFRLSSLADSEIRNQE